ncbi:MAG TPA: UDP-3-O-(3-hydroxymyristoyl)glucosamine N-acyltransferase [Candidatus Deferrimicrobiaceae bacterium]
MPNSMTLAELASKISARIEGPSEMVVTGVAPLDEAGPGQVSFIAQGKYVSMAAHSKASAIITKEPIPGSSATFLISDNPYYAFAGAVELFHPPYMPPAGVSPKADIHPDASIGSGVAVSAFVSIADGATVGEGTILFQGVVVGRNVKIGAGCRIYPNVVLYDDVVIGNRVILHSGSVIGSDGFGFAPSRSGYKKIPQVGTVEIADDVEIGANTTVDRAALGVTRIGRGTKLDNLVQVGHNVVIGTDTVIASQAGISGSCKIGNRVMIGGQAGLAGHLEIEDGIMLGAKSGVPDTLKASTSRVWSGIPAMPHGTWLRMATLLPKLPELFRRVSRLEKPNPAQGES